jgi:hypothetical protein
MTLETLQVKSASITYLHSITTLHSDLHVFWVQLIRPHTKDMQILQINSSFNDNINLLVHSRQLKALIPTISFI